MKNKVGDISNFLEILEIKGSGAGKHKRFTCKCQICNKIFETYSSNFKKGKSCSCKKHLFNDLTGKEFGKIRVISLIERSFRKDKSKSSGHLYNCKCLICGTEYQYSTSVISRKDFLGCRCPKDLTLASKNLHFNSYKTNALKRNLQFDLTFDEFVKICNLPCYYSGIEKSLKINRKDLFGYWECNGIDRLDNSKGYTIENSVPCSSIINMMKGTLSEKEFLKIIRLIYENKKL